MKIKEFLCEYTDKEKVQYFILDSHQNTDNNNYEDEVYKKYHYSKKRYNKLKKGDIFIYRCPKRSSRSGKFYFFGGGVVEEIIDKKQGEEGDVIAIITQAFSFAQINQGDDLLEKFEWKFKKRKENSWGHFFAQYGMNLITKEDFDGLFKELECTPVKTKENNNVLNDELEEISVDNVEFKLMDVKIYENQIKDESKNKRKVKNTTKISIKRDYSAEHEKKKSIGDLGEDLIMQYETEKLKGTGFKPEHISKKIGDGEGYDILSYDENRKPIKIEVKSTTKNVQDGFFMSSHELEVSKKEGENYYIYRVYGINKKTGEWNLMIYPGSVEDTKFNIKPTTYKITLK